MPPGKSDKGIQALPKINAQDAEVWSRVGGRGTKGRGDALGGEFGKLSILNQNDSSIP